MNKDKSREAVHSLNPRSPAGMPDLPPQMMFIEKKGRRAGRPLRAVWTLNLVMCVFGMAMAGAVMGFSWQNNGQVGDVAAWMALVSGSLGLLLIEVGGLMALVLSVLAMVRGAVFRGMVAFGGYCLASWLAAIMFTGAMSWHIKNRDEHAAAGTAERSEKPADGAAGQPVKAEPKADQPAPAALPPEPELVLTLTNTKGVTITARVLSVDEFGKVKLIKDGREFVIEVGTLNKESQDKIWNWQSGK